jgi:Leucine-rich repeat (LRR) protein
VNLKFLDLSTNEFQTFPDSRCFPPALNSLNMSDNQVRSLCLLAHRTARPRLTFTVFAC